MDLFVQAERLPAVGETVFGKQFSTYPGGKGSNQAAAAGRLGAPTYLVGRVGYDNFAEILLDSLEAGGVDTRLVRRSENGAATGTALVTVDAAGQNTIVVIGAANLECSPADVDAAFAALPEPGFLLLQHEIPAAANAHAIREGKRRGWQIIVNPAPAYMLDPAVMADIDILIPNEHEIGILSGCPDVGSPEKMAEAAEVLLAQGVKRIIITLGAQGAMLCYAGGRYHVPAFQVKAVDTTVAGDAYTGALAVALAEGMAFGEAMRFAGAAAAVAVTRYGAQPALPSRSEVLALLQQPLQK